MCLGWVKSFLIFMSLFLTQNARMLLTPVPPLDLGLLATTFTFDLGLETKLGDGGPVGRELGPATAGCACTADLIALGSLFPAGNLFVRGIL